MNPSRKKLAILLATGLLTLLLLTASTWAPVSPHPQPIAQETPPPNAAALEASAHRFIELLAQGSYSAAFENFDPAMAQALPPARLETIWTGLVSSYGPYQGPGETVTAASGEYTAVNTRAQFERAEVNLRVVFDQQGRIAGFFQTALTPNQAVPAGVIATLAFTTLFVVLLPLVLAFILWRRTRVSWVYFAFGAGIFMIFQLMTRIPLVGIAQAALGPVLTSSVWITFAWLVLLSFTAGLFEEVGRYVGYRWLMPRAPRTWPVGVMYGLGHGGIEAIILVGLNGVISIALALLYPTISGSLPTELRGPLVQQLAALSGAPVWLPLLAAWERLWAVLLHVALSLTVLQVFRRGQIKWLWVAIAAHTLANVVGVALPTIIPMARQTAQFLSAGLLLLVGLASVWAILRYRAQEAATAPGPALPG